MPRCIWSDPTPLGRAPKGHDKRRNQQDHADDDQDEADRRPGVRPAAVRWRRLTGQHARTGVVRVGQRRLENDPDDKRYSAGESPGPGGSAHAKQPIQGTKRGQVTRADLGASYRRLLAGDVGQIVSALYSYGARLVDERRAARDDAPGQGPGAPCTVPTSGRSRPLSGRAGVDEESG